MPIYPVPSMNPHCRCRTDSRQVLCRTGHLLECHYPYSCELAACGHLDRYYGLAEQELAHYRALRAAARARLERLDMDGYALDAQGELVAVPFDDAALGQEGDTA